MNAANQGGNNLMQTAKNAVNRITNAGRGQFNEQEKQAAQQAIQSAYADSTPEEKQQLQQLEEQLRRHNEL
nr:DUF3813 family protein [Thalassobacillus devorans]